MRVTAGERTASGVSHGSARRGGLRALYRRVTKAAEVDRARREGFAQGRAGYSEFALGRAALLDARALAASLDGIGPALLLFRASVRLFERAHEKRAGDSGSAPIEPHLAGAPGATAAPSVVPALSAALQQLTPEQRRAIDAALDAQAGESALARLGDAERRDLLPLFERLALELGEPLELEADRVRRVEAGHWMRRSLLMIVAIVAAGWLGFAVFGRKNLARDKAVVTSSAEPKVGVAAPRCLVDGDRKNLGFHTLKLPGQFATIDLGRVETIHSVDVYNRFDCCQARAIPLRLDVSTDGVTWTTLGRKTETFALWSVHVPSTPARFVRLTGEGNNFFHLSEVEVY
jgi:F5/8 type C domain-containing protein